MELDDLKNTWKALDGRLDRLEAQSLQTAQRVARGNASSTQHKLVVNFRAKAVVGFSLPLFGPVLISFVGLPPVVGIIYALFGLIAGIANLLFANYIKRHDFMSLPVVQAVAAAERISARRRRLQLANILLAALVIGILLFYMYHTELMPLFWGGLAGLVLGSAIGYANLRRQSKLLRTLATELKSIQGE